MDVNGTKFHLVFGKEDWLRDSPLKGLAWDTSGCCLTLNPLMFRFPQPAGEKLLNSSDRRGADIDSYGNIYWIDGTGTEIRILNSGSRTSSHFWSSDDENDECNRMDFKDEEKEIQQTLFFSGLAVTEYHYLVAGVISPPGYLVFDLLSGGSPMRMIWQKKDSDDPVFSPFDMAKVPGGGALILDKDNKCCYSLDRYLRLVPCTKKTEITGEDFKPENEQNKKTFSYRGTEAAYAIDAKNPVSVAAITENSFVILDSDPREEHSFLLLYKKGKPVLKYSLEKILRDHVEDTGSYGIFGHDIVFVPENSDKRIFGTLYITNTGGNQVFAFELLERDDNFVIHLLPKYYPMRLFSGKALISDGKNAYYDLGERWMQIFEQPVPLYEKKGVFETRIDSNEIDCVWHRLLLDAFIPQGAVVKVESKAANIEEELKYLDWREEPRFYLRGNGAEIPYYYAFPRKIDGQGTWELLFQQAEGRYLSIRLTVEGTGINSPALVALRIHYPRFSYLKKYLPSVYRDDPVSASFLDRFLANMEGTFTETEGKIQNAETLFDVRTIHPEYLGWLAGWFGIMLDSKWEEKRKRLFLSHAVSMFRERGTISGILRTIMLATDPCPDETLFGNVISSSGRKSVRIVERYLLRRAPGVVYGDTEGSEGPGVTTEISNWKPEDGALYIHRKFRSFLEKRYAKNGVPSPDALSEAWGMSIPGFDKITFPPVLPDNRYVANDWKLFLKQGIGFMYAEVSSVHKDLYRDFLAEKYRKIEELNRKYQPPLKSFGEVSLPSSLPEDITVLSDWIQFVSTALPIRQNAHKFIVLVPEMPGENEEVRNIRSEKIRRIVEMEKPAHTQFDIKPYFSLFRVGEARLGIDTELGKGCRFTALVLGKSRLEESALASYCPGDLRGRMYVRD